MSIDVNDERIKQFAEQIAGDIKTQSDLNDFTKALQKAAIEAALGGELNHHLGYEKHSPEGNGSGNSRNGKSKKRLKGNHGEIEIEVPRDRAGSFEPVIVEKNQRRLTAMDDQILALYAKGMTTRDIADAFQEMYGAEVSHSLISSVTDAVHERVQAWQNRPLERLYPIMYLDCIMVNVHEDKRVIKKAVYVALAINMEGKKELLGLWISKTEGSKFWMSVLTEIKNRGVEDVFIMCVDGLKGFAQAIEGVFPHCVTQTCIVHLIRNSLKYVSYKDRKEIAADLKNIYKAVNAEEAELALDELAEKWDEKYSSVSKVWRDAWERLTPFLSYPPEIRKVIYTTMKTLYLAITKASERWTMPIQNWPMALNRFSLEFGDRMDHQ